MIGRHKANILLLKVPIEGIIGGAEIIAFLFIVGGAIFGMSEEAITGAYLMGWN